MSLSHSHLRALRGHMLRSCLFAGLFLNVLALGSCGFEPLYSSNSSANELDVMTELGKVKISTIPNRQGVSLRNALLARINPQGEPTSFRYRLDVSYEQIVENYGRRRDATTSQRRYRMVARYTLKDGNTVLLRRSSTVYASFSILDEQFATTMAERNAEERGAVELAEDIRLQLAAYFKGTTKPKKETEDQSVTSTTTLETRETPSETTKDQSAD